MKSILVTGATGTLGTAVLGKLARRGRTLRALSRRAPSAPREAITWVAGDLTTGQGMESACEGTGVVVHCASDGRTRHGDVTMTRRLLEAARREKPHIVYISIVGVDRLPLGYYSAKLEAENLLVSSGLPYTILRATQFHDLLYRILSTLERSPIIPLVAGLRFQPIEVEEVADRLVDLALGEPAGRVSDVGGPAVRSAAELARTYLRARHRQRLLVPVPLVGKIGRSFRDGANLAPDHAVGRRSWEEYLAARLGSNAPL